MNWWFNGEPGGTTNAPHPGAKRTPRHDFRVKGKFASDPLQVDKAYRGIMKADQRKQHQRTKLRQTESFQAFVSGKVKPSDAVIDKLFEDCPDVGDADNSPLENAVRRVIAAGMRVFRRTGEQVRRAIARMPGCMPNDVQADIESLQSAGYVVQ
jgi:hypothetical protein